MWASMILMITGIDYDTIFEKTFDPEQKYILCANHTSLLDITFFALLLNDKYRFVAKWEFSQIPLFGIFFRTIDIAVKRESKVESFKAFKKFKESLDEGYSLVIFPEGTTSEHPPLMRDFKNGPFKLAIATGTSIVPVSFLDNYVLFEYHNRNYCKPGTAKVVVHEPIETAHLNADDVEMLKNQVYTIIDDTIRPEYESRQAIS